MAITAGNECDPLTPAEPVGGKGQGQCCGLFLASSRRREASPGISDFHLGFQSCLGLLAPRTGEPGDGGKKSLSCVQLFATPWTVARQAPLVTGFSRPEYWSGWPFPFPGDLPDPGTEPGSPALQTDSLPLEPPGTPFLGKYLSPYQRCACLKVIPSCKGQSERCQLTNRVGLNQPRNHTFRGVE